ncbi:hypothetical protein M434DRAFT_13829 [Hypoxylon sp. CO27-5]|nr:hypothetical protein M434DRAFT_13829 [Hypoxylon sp. CO27-5]
MRVLKKLAAAAAIVFGAGAIGAPIRSNSDLSGNTTSSYGVFPSVLRCLPNFGPGVNLTDSEAISMETCFNNTFSHYQACPYIITHNLYYDKSLTIRAASWYEKAYPCPQTNRFFQIWGHHWNQPEHCWAACNECILDSIRNKTANVACDKAEGVMALCHITYDTAPPYAKWPPDEPPPP